MLLLWTLNAAVVWAVSIKKKDSQVRLYALVLSFLFVGGRALWHGDATTLPVQLLLNARFISLVFVAALYFVPAWYLRTRSNQDQGIKLMDYEARLPYLLHVLGNVVLFAAVSMEIHSWFRGITSMHRGISTAEQLTYSITWAIYAGVLVAVGFWLKYSLPRMMGLIGFLLVTLKIFFVDLANQPLIFRVMALAALGGMLLLTSYWYQKYSKRIELAESNESENR